MYLSRLINAIAITSFLVTGALATPSTLQTVTYNFQLAGGGGGVSSVLGGSLAIETFCIDFANDIFVPGTYSANVTPLVSGSDLSLTRFGLNSSWQTVNISDGDPITDAADAAIINAAGNLDRYQMAAYLISQYHQGDGATDYNNGIQSAIWDILDPASYPASPTSGDRDGALELAAEWYSGTSSGARDAYLANYRILSDYTMTNCNGTGLPLCYGFQEQLAGGLAVPEPRGLAWILLGLLPMCFAFRRVLAVRLRA